MKNFRILTILTALVFTLALMAAPALAAEKGGLAAVKAAGVIKVGNSPDYPPFETIDDNGKRVGFDIDLMNAIAKIIGVKVKWVTLDFGAIVTAVQSGQVDIGMSGFSITEERKQQVSFTDPYFISGQVVISTPDSKVKTQTDLNGASIAVGLGTTGQKAAEKIEGAKLVFPDDYNVCFVMLKNQGVDAVVADIAVAEQYIKQGGFVQIGKPLTYEETAIIVEKVDNDIVKALNEALKKIKASGEYDKLVAKWKL